VVQLEVEGPQHLEGIRAVNRAAFGGEDEVQLVDRLRDDGLVVASLVALRHGEVAGHILFSELPIRRDDTGAELPAASLAPMAVHPRIQRVGVGSLLVRAGLEVCRGKGKAAVLVLGHASYYPRFGFSVELGKRVRSPYSGDSWMALELTSGALSTVTGSVQYPAAFGLLER
jgi:putative acetyltransferase